MGLNGKLQTIYGVITPFTKELIGSGVDMSLHSSIPVEIEGKITRGEIELAIRTPSEIMRSGRQTENLHVFVMPYSFKYNFLQVTPITHSLSLKKISSGIKRQPVEMEIGQSLGLSSHLLSRCLPSALTTTQLGLRPRSSTLSSGSPP